MAGLAKVILWKSWSDNHFIAISESVRKCSIRVKIRDFFPSDLEIWQMTLKNNRALFLGCFNLCASFHSHQWIQSKVTVRKRSIRFKMGDFFVPCDLEIWRITFKNNRAPFLCYFKLCASFRCHWWNETGVTVRKRPIWVKIVDFLAVWPWNLTDDLEKQQGTSPKQHQAFCIISSSYVNSNWSYGPETAKLGFDRCDLDLWPLTLTFCMDITFVIGDNSWKFPDDTMMGTWWKRCDRRTDWQTDGPNHS